MLETMAAAPRVMSPATRRGGAKEPFPRSRWAPEAFSGRAAMLTVWVATLTVVLLLSVGQPPNCALGVWETVVGRTDGRRSPCRTLRLRGGRRATRFQAEQRTGIVGVRVRVWVGRTGVCASGVVTAVGHGWFVFLGKLAVSCCCRCDIAN